MALGRVFWSAPTLSLTGGPLCARLRSRAVCACASRWADAHGDDLIRRALLSLAPPICSLSVCRSRRSGLGFYFLSVCLCLDSPRLRVILSHLCFSTAPVGSGSRRVRPTHFSACALPGLFAVLHGVSGLSFTLELKVVGYRTRKGRAARAGVHPALRAGWTPTRFAPAYARVSMPSDA